MAGPKQLIVYQNSRHSIRGPAAANGPHPQTFMSDWIADRLARKPMHSEKWLVEASGRIVKTPL
jgi:hypothetical protein